MNRIITIGEARWAILVTFHANHNFGPRVRAPRKALEAIGWGIRIPLAIVTALGSEYLLGLDQNHANPAKFDALRKEARQIVAKMPLSERKAAARLDEIPMHMLIQLEKEFRRRGMCIGAITVRGDWAALDSDLLELCYAARDGKQGQAGNVS